MSGNLKFDLPYFDEILQNLQDGKPEAIETFGRHVHWGYWENSADSDGSIEDFAQAAEKLAQKVYSAGQIADGMSVLDCGCGFGGTIASINERFNNMQLTGLNIDSRQLARAREQVQPRAENQIEFIEGNACELPFEDNSFDVVLAVECIFHFPSRERFFQEASRVLKPGGKLALSDFSLIEMIIPITKITSKLIKGFAGNYYGNVDTNFSLTDYHKLSKKIGFKTLIEEDITRNTLPTYPVVRQVQTWGEKATAVAEWASILGIMRYLILSYTKEE